MNYIFESENTVMSLTYDAYKLVKKQMHSNPYRVKVNKLIDCFEIKGRVSWYVAKFHMKGSK